MLTAYRPQDRGLQPIAVKQSSELPEDAIWVDLLQPTPEETRWVEEKYAHRLPTLESIAEIEATSRVFQDALGFHLRSFFLDRRRGLTVNVTVGFLLSAQRLFTLRDEPLAVFEEFAQMARGRPAVADAPTALLIGLFEAQVDLTADILEDLYESLDGKELIEHDGDALGRQIGRIANIEDTNGKARLGLMDKQHVLTYFARLGLLTGEYRERLNDLLRDLDSLLTHSTFLSEKVSFLTEITLGRISIEQNRVIKILSVAATVFLPPTLIASIYGMNFRLMPELDWPLGYPLALLLIILSAWLPYRYFKRRGWL